MKVWIDAQIAPGLADWMRNTLGVDATPLRALGLQGAKDLEIFNQARQSAPS